MTTCATLSAALLLLQLICKVLVQYINIYIGPLHLSISRFLFSFLMVGHMYKDVDQVNEVTMNSSCHALWVQFLSTLLTAFPKKFYTCVK